MQSPHTWHKDHIHGEVDVKILGREKNRLRRGIKEAIEIKRNKPTLNKNTQDRYFLSPIYDNLISNTRSKIDRAEKVTKEAVPIPDQPF